MSILAVILSSRLKTKQVWILMYHNSDHPDQSFYQRQLGNLPSAKRKSKFFDHCRQVVRVSNDVAFAKRLAQDLSRQPVNEDIATKTEERNVNRSKRI